MLGVEFAQKRYVLTILKDVEDEVRRSSRLQFLYPWFDNDDIKKERVSKRVRLKAEEKKKIISAQSVFRQHVLSDASRYTSLGRSPPSPTDCYILAFGQIRSSIVATDDLGMHLLAKDFEIPIWHGHELLKKMLSGKHIENSLVKEIFEALEGNDDLPKSWKDIKHSDFKKIFGPDRKDKK